MAISTYLSIITLNVKGLNVPVKRHRVAEWIQKQDPYICCLQETHFRSKDTHKLKVREWKKVFHPNGNQKKPGVAILISDKRDFFLKHPYWSIIAFQWCGSFCFITKWISYTYTCPHISSLLRLPPSHPPYPTPLGGHKTTSWSPCAMWLLPTSYLFHVW